MSAVTDPLVNDRSHTVPDDDAERAGTAGGADTSGAGRFRRLARLLRSSLQTTAFAGVLGVALTVYTSFGLVNESSKLSVMLPLLVVVAGALAVVAVNDVETFVLVALAMRSSMDALKLGDSDVLDPGAMLGLFVLGLGVVWLMNRRARMGSAYPTSRLGTSMVIFITVALIGIVTSSSRAASVVEWSRIAGIIVVFLVVEQLAARSWASNRVIAAVCCAVPVPAAVALFQALSGKGLFEAGGFFRVTGTFTHSNPLSYFCAIVTVALVALIPAVRERRRLMLVAVLAVTVPILLLTYTRSAWLATFAAVVVLLLQHNRKLILPLVGGILALVLLVPSIGDRFSDLETTKQASGQAANSLEWRLQYWGEALKLSESSPVTGIGLKAVANTTDEAKQPHNDFVRAFVELGVPGLLAYVWMLFQMCRSALVAVRATEHLGRKSVERGLALAGLGVVTVVVVLSVVANLMSQGVVMWYAVAIMALSSGNLLRRARLETQEAARRRSDRQLLERAASPAEGG